MFFSIFWCWYMKISPLPCTYTLPAGLPDCKGDHTRSRVRAHVEALQKSTSIWVYGPPRRLQIPNMPSPKPCNRKQTSQCRQLNEKFLRTILVFLLQFLKSGLSGYLIQQNLGLFLSTQWDRKITKHVVKCMLTMEWETYKNSTIVLSDRSTHSKYFEEVIVLNRNI